VILDTSALLAYFDANEPAHGPVAGALESAGGPLVVSPYVVAELDYLLLTRRGTNAEQAVLTELGSGAWELAAMDRDRVRAATVLVSRYADVPVGIADASCIVLAEAYGDPVIATLDHRHFGILRFSDGSAPTIVP
jgi:predicted nucleic acid-binding protein